CHKLHDVTCRLALLHRVQESLEAILRPSLRGRASARPQAEQPSISKLIQCVGSPQLSHGKPRRTPIGPKPGALHLGHSRCSRLASFQASARKTSIRVGLRCARMSERTTASPSSERLASRSTAATTSSSVDRFLTGWLPSVLEWTNTPKRGKPSA